MGAVHVKDVSSGSSGLYTKPEARTYFDSLWHRNVSSCGAICLENISGCEVTELQRSLKS